MHDIMPQTFSILVTGSPYTSQAHYSAQAFVQAIYQLNHSVLCVFFYQEAVYVANKAIHTLSDESNPQQNWIQLAKVLKFELHACMSVSQKRGILDQSLLETSSQVKTSSQADTMSQTMITCEPSFQLSGLGTWAEVSHISDRVVHFS